MVHIWSGLTGLHLAQDLKVGIDSQLKPASKLPFVKWQKGLAGPCSEDFSNR